MENECKTWIESGISMISAVATVGAVGVALWQNYQARKHVKDDKNKELINAEKYAKELTKIVYSLFCNAYNELNNIVDPIRHNYREHLNETGVILDNLAAQIPGLKDSLLALNRADLVSTIVYVQQNLDSLVGSIKAIPIDEVSNSSQGGNQRRFNTARDRTKSKLQKLIYNLHVMTSDPEEFKFPERVKIIPEKDIPHDWNPPSPPLT